jgi:hypothetical protein
MAFRARATPSSRSARSACVKPIQAPHITSSRRRPRASTMSVVCFCSRNLLIPCSAGRGFWRSPTGAPVPRLSRFGVRTQQGSKRQGSSRKHLGAARLVGLREGLLRHLTSSCRPQQKPFLCRTRFDVGVEMVGVASDSRRDQRLGLFDVHAAGARRSRVAGLVRDTRQRQQSLCREPQDRMGAEQPDGVGHERHADIGRIRGRA